RTRWVSVIWLKISTRAPRAGGFWGTHTEQTRRHKQLINRFDYDGDYGTVLNRLLIKAAIGYPLKVHGTGGQTRAFIHIQDSVRYIEMALK
ncbi:hypothetical protein ACC672_37015, partial [Rhizobium ruizarguesonis]